MKKGSILYGAACFMLGAVLCGGASAYAAGIMAERSTNTVYVDGQKVELKAYVIDGSNYVMLRDVGQAVGFNVYWDGTVQIESDKPYTGVAPAEQTFNDADSANPAIFKGTYTREAYNALREAVATGKESKPIAMSQETRDAMQAALTVFGSWPVYHLKTDSNGRSYFTPYYPEAYKQAAQTCQPFIDSLSGKSDAEKVRQIAYYLCDRLTYKAGSFATPDKVLVSDAVKYGNCMTYAHNFMFLCGMADIPCVYLHSATHQWNEVYVDGQWWSVDVSGVDVGDDMSVRQYVRVLNEPSTMQGATFKIQDGERVTFAKEVLVPGSPK